MIGRTSKDAAINFSNRRLLSGTKSRGTVSHHTLTGLALPAVAGCAAVAKEDGQHCCLIGHVAVAVAIAGCRACRGSTGPVRTELRASCAQWRGIRQRVRRSTQGRGNELT